MSLLKSWPDYSVGGVARHADVEGVVGALTTVAAATYSASITVDASAQQYVQIVATDTVAFTINNPTNAKAGMSLVFDIRNSSGGTLGTPTWGTLFKLAGTLTKPADTKRKTISFYCDGAAWIEESRAAADI